MIALNKEKLPLYSKVFISIIYTVGIFGIIFSPALFLPLTPFNLLISAGFLFYFHPNKDRNFYRFIILVYCAGFAIEMLGVQSGKIFGSYHYGNMLGFKVKETPLIIGLNWVVLTYCTGTIVQNLSQSFFVRSLLGATLMVAFDFFIEWYAPHADFWYWQNDVIPLQNFLAWFVFSFFFNLLFCSLQLEKKNSFALFLFLIQLLFFILLNLYHQFYH